MSLTEQPVNIVSSRGSGMFVLGDHTKRVDWINSFYVSPAPNLTYMDRGGVSFVGYGAVKDSNGTTHDQIGFDNQGSTTIWQEMYVSEPLAGVITGQVTQASSLNPSFPAGSLPVAVVVLDGVQRVQQTIDFRPSYLSSAPNLGSGMTESVVDATKRVYFQNNYAVPRTYSLSAQIPADMAIPAAGFFLGSGAVVISGITHSSPTIFISSSPKANTQGLQLAANAINQGYVDPTSGAVTIRQVTTSGTFPANCLPLFECTTDSVSLIRGLVDFRPSYI